MEFQCKNCKNRRAWDCEDYHWGYLDTTRCNDRFELDITTLSPKEKNAILKLAEAINQSEEE